MNTTQCAAASGQSPLGKRQLFLMATFTAAVLIKPVHTQKEHGFALGRNMFSVRAHPLLLLHLLSHFLLIFQAQKRGMDSDPCSATCLLCDLEQVASPL